MNNSKQSFTTLLLDILQMHPDGIREYDLIQLLQDEDQQNLPENSFADSVSLFQTHFILFNALYELKDRLNNAGEFDIEITSILVKLTPRKKPDSRFPAKPDPLREYYLDLSNLEGVTEEQVNELLNSFWKRLQNYNNRDEALITLGLETDASDEEIRIRYKKLVMEHRPDRGGDKDKLTEINLAMGRLKKSD